MHGDFGKKATDLVGNLVEQSMRDIPHQLRLIQIYTREPDLMSVADDAYKALVDRIGKQFIRVEDGSDKLILTTDNSRVVILGKRTKTSPLGYLNFFVHEEDLAQRTISEFSQLASGLLQGIVLRGIAKIRENNRRILTRFHKDLDIAFLTHRALLLPDEAFGQIIPLLTDELCAVLEDTLGESPLGKGQDVKRILDDWCDEYWRIKNHAKLSIGEGANGLEFVKDVFCNGPTTKKKRKTLLNDREKDHCHEKLSSLMSQRVRYDNSRRALHLGVIVRELADEKRYLLCLQPVCDSVRIGGKNQAFIFCVLDKPTNNKLLTHCVMDDSGKVIQLRYKPKVSSLFVSNFKGNDDAVYATKKDEKDRFIFEGEGKKEEGKGGDKKNYEWIAELKTEHAQRAAEQFGRELSRVGLTESEWLRIKAK